MSCAVKCLKPGCDRSWPRDPVLEVECPSCGAGIGRRCKRPSGHTVWSSAGRFCPARDLAADQAGAYGVCPLKRCGSVNLEPGTQAELV